VRDGTTEVIGTLVRFGTDSIVVRSDVTVYRQGRTVKEKQELAMALTSNTRMDVSVGRRSNGGRGAMIGGGVGLGLAALTAIAAAATYDENSMGGAEPGVAFLGGVILFVPAGSLIGFAIGSASKTETWSEVPLELRPRTDPYEVTEGMVRLGLRINF